MLKVTVKLSQNTSWLSYVRVVYHTSRHQHSVLNL